MDELTKIIQNLGFPVVAFLWLALRVEKKLDAQIISSQKLEVCLAVIAKTLDVPDEGGR